MTQNNDILEQLSSLSSDAKRALLTRLMQAQSAPIERWEPLSYNQQALWFHMNLTPESTAYNLLYSVRLFEAINTPVLQHACQQLVQRYPILTATFALHDEKPAQHIQAHQTLPIQEIDATTWSSEALRHALTSSSNQVIDLTQGPLFRILLFRCNAEETILAFIAHHIILDFWAFNILIDELFTLYSAAKTGSTVTLPPLSGQHSDYVQWQQTMLDSTSGQQHWHYWQEILSSPFPVLQMPTDHPRPPVQHYRGSTFELTLSPTLTQQIRMLASKEKVTPFTLVLAAYQTLLFRYTNQDDILIGTPTLGRDEARFERLIDDVTNPVIIRSRLTSNHSFIQLLRQTQQQIFQALEHQDYPFSLLVEHLQPERNLSYAPLYQTAFTWDKPLRTTTSMLTSEPFLYGQQGTLFDLALTIFEIDTKLIASFRYNTDLFEPATIERLAHHFLVLLEGIVAQPERPIQQLPLLTQQEQQHIVLDQNRTDTPLSHARSLHQLIAEQAQRTPDALALVVSATALSYRELNERANQVAHRLRREGVGADIPVGVCVERSPELLILLLGILKAGGCYIPLDPGYPTERLTWMLDDAHPALVLTQKPLHRQLSTLTHRLCDLEELWPELAREETSNPPDGSDPQQTAYIIYTSGSTGRPKGVMISHHNVLNFFVGMDATLPVEERQAQNRWLAVTSISFDISVLELFWTLSRGFQVVLQTESETRISSHNQEAAPTQQKKDIEFSLFYFANAAYEESAKEGYRLLLEGAQFADQHGFSAVWTPERHFHEFGGLYPNPSVISAALATLTRNIHIRAGSVVLPLHHPIRVAEEWALVDQLSHGRTGMAFASGWNANDFAFAPENYAQRKAVMTRNIETVRALWRGESVTIQNGHGEAVEVRTFPRPIQAELPVWITSSGNIETFQLAGASGANVLTHLLGQNLKDLAQKIAAYHEAWQQHGHAIHGKRGHITLMVHTFIGTDLQTVHDIVRQPFSNYLRSSADLMKSFAERFGQTNIELSKDDADALIAHAFERYVGTSGLMGTVESCLPLVEQIKQLGVDEIACLIDFGVAADEVLASLQHLAALKDQSNERPIQPPKDQSNDERPIQPPKEELSIAQQISLSGASYLQCTPSLMHMLLLLPETAEALRSVRHLLLGGEALPLSLVKTLQTLTTATIHNMYGPTETTIWSSTAQLSPASSRIILGQPIANTQLYILDNELQPVPIGVAGELYISGKGIARGYLNRPELTAERFVPNQWSGNNGTRMYRTGDLTRYLANGDIEYLGRIDQQVKIRGHRIELGEIESALFAHPAVRECVVMVREDIPDEKRLVAYIVEMPGKMLTINDLRTSLQEHLPDSMLPTAFVFLNAMPLTSNGKVDRRALPPPEQLRPELVEAFVAPESTVETTLATIWSHLLKVDKIGVHDNFFTLGGDSILSIQVVSRAQSAGLHLTPRQIFQYQTIAELAAALTSQTRNISLRRYQQDAVSGEIALMPMQHWFFTRRLAQPQYFNQAVLINIPHHWHQSLLQRIFDALIVHHDALRARFTLNNIGWRQYFAEIEQASSVPLSWNDLTQQPLSTQQATIEKIIRQTQASLDLHHGPLIHVAAFVSAIDQPIQLFVAIHHLVIDGVSWRILLEDLHSAATQLLENKPIQFAAKTASLHDWTQHLSAMTATPLIQDSRTYWEEIVQHASVSLPHDMPSGDNTQASAHTITVTLSVEETQQFLHEAMRPYQSTAQELLLVALLQTLAGWLGHQNIRIELEGHGREELGETPIDTSRTIGWFTSLFPQLFPLRQEWDMVHSIKTIKEQLRAIPQNGVSYGLLRYLDNSQEAQWPETTAEILFNYLGQFDQLADHGFSAAQPLSTLMGNIVHPENQRTHLLEINSIISNDQLSIQWTYSEQIHSHQTIQKVATTMLRNLQAVLTHCLSDKAGSHTPSDFPLAQLTQASLDQIELRHHFSDIYPLSPTQEGMLFHSLYEKTSGIYIHQFACSITGPLDLEAFAQSWQHIVIQHPMLRASFYWEDLEKPQQIIHSQASLPIDWQDWQQYTIQQQQNQLETFLAEDRAHGFDLQHAPLMRLTLLHLAPETTRLIWTYHHVLLDGWSLPLILQEVFDYYVSLRQTKRIHGVARRPYRDYITWLQQQDSTAAETYWRQQLAGFKAATPLGIMQPDSTPTSLHELSVKERYVTIYHQLSTEQTADWRQKTRHQQLTLNTLFQGAWSLLLARYSQQRDILFGNVVSGRPPTLANVEQMIGLFINTVPVRVQIPDQISVEAWLHILQAQQAEQHQYETSSLVEIQGWSEILRNHSFFESLLVFENYPLDMTLLSQPHELQITEVSLAEQTNYPLVLTVGGTTELTLQITYNRQRFASEAMQRFMDHLLMILEQFVQTPKLHLAQISLLTMEERAQQLYSWNNIAIPLSAHEEVDRQALSSSDNQQSMSDANVIPPQTLIQKQLAEIWCQLLALPHVSLQDNFFALDSHLELLTKLVARIQSTFEVNISQHDLLEASTLQSMALCIEQIQNEIITQADDEKLMQLLAALESQSDNEIQDDIVNAENARKKEKEQDN